MVKYLSHRAGDSCLYFITMLQLYSTFVSSIRFVHIAVSIPGLPLVSAPHLARSYHHLFPLESFEEFPTSTMFKQNRYALLFSCNLLFSPDLFPNNFYSRECCHFRFCQGCQNICLKRMWVYNYCQLNQMIVSRTCQYFHRFIFHKIRRVLPYNAGRFMSSLWVLGMSTIFIKILNIKFKIGS